MEDIVHYLLDTSYIKCPEKVLTLLRQFFQEAPFDHYSWVRIQGIVYRFLHAMIGDKTPLKFAKRMAQEAALQELRHWEEETWSKTIDRKARGRQALELAIKGNALQSDWFHRISQDAEERRPSAFQTYQQNFRNHNVILSDNQIDAMIDDLEDKSPKEILYLLDNVPGDVFQIPFLDWLCERGHNVVLLVQGEESGYKTIEDDLSYVFEHEILKTRFHYGHEAGSRFKSIVIIPRHRG